MTLLKQSTARTILVGPVLDSNGAAKTDEVVANIKITKNGTVGAPDGSATLTHDHAGKYKLALTANDIDTLGVLEISLNSGTNDMPVVRFNVVPANVFDSLVGGSDNLDVTLANGAQGGSSAVLTLKQVVINNSTGVGLDIDGTIAGATINASNGNAVALTSTGGSGAGLKALAHGAGSGIYAIGGETAGEGIYALGGAGGGHGMRLLGTASGGHGLYAQPGTGGNAINAASISGTLDTVTTLTNWHASVTDWTDGGRLDVILDAIPTTGSGSSSWTVNVKVGGNPIDGAEVRITSDQEGNTAVAGPKYTDASGNVTFLLDPGTYYVWVQSAGYDFNNPTTMVVT